MPFAALWLLAQCSHNGTPRFEHWIMFNYMTTEVPAHFA